LAYASRKHWLVSLRADPARAARRLLCADSAAEQFALLRGYFAAPGCDGLQPATAGDWQAAQSDGRLAA
jgi:hypothetical protein